MSEEIDLGSLQPIEQKYRIDGKLFVLREADDSAATRYKDAKMRAIKLEDGRASGITGGSDADTQLLADCLHEFNEEKQELRSVPVIYVRKWPTRHVQPLVKKLKEISGIDESDTVDQIDREIAVLQRRREKLLKEGTPAKNSPEGGPTTSP